METTFFILSKLIGYLIRVDLFFALAFSLLVLSVFMNWHRTAKSLGVALLTALVTLAFVPLGDVALRPFEQIYPANPPLQDVDGIIVLGGSEDTIASSYWSQPQLGPSADRLVHTAALAKRFPEAQIIFSGGGNRLRDLGKLRVSEADVAREVLTSLKLSQARLTLESTSRNTAENAKRSLVLANPKPGETWVLITSAFHMPRAIRSFEAAGWPRLVAFPVDYRTRGFSDGLGWNLVGNINNLNTAIKELIGLTTYRVFGL